MTIERDDASSRTTASGVADVQWTGAGWRVWRVQRVAGGRLLLRNPWTNSGHLALWERGEVQTAVCFWPWRCNGYVSAACTCGIRSIATLPYLTDFLRADNQLDRHPLKASVVGRVQIGGRIQNAIPGRTAPGYQRSEFARIYGPLYVSPVAADRFEGLRHTYAVGNVDVVTPDFITGATSQQDWIDRLAERVTEIGEGIPSFRGRWDPIEPPRRSHSTAGEPRGGAECHR